jgi:hypothetical protein
VDGPAAVDEHDAVAEPLHVAHVVGGEQQGGAVVAPLGHQELAQPLLRQHVQPDGGLVEDDQPGPVEQRGGHLGAHPLTQRELPHRSGEELAQLQPLHQLLAPGRGVGGGEPVDGGQQGEGLAGGQVPPQLRPLPEDHTDLTGQPAPFGDRAQPAGADLAGGRHEDAAEHLDRRGLPRPVGADVTDCLAGLHPQRQVVDGHHGAPSHALAHPEGPGQAVGLDDVRGHPPAPW